MFNYIKYDSMQENIFYSIIILSISFCTILIAIILIINRYHRNIEAKNKEMYKSIILAEEKERERLSRDVHDELGGLITSSRLTLESIYLDDKDPETIEKINRIINILEMASLSARNASMELSPIALQNFGLKGALETFPNLYRSYNGVFDIKCNVDALNSSVEIGIFRIISEILNNSVKYSNANKIYVDVFVDDHSDLNVLVGDNGNGFDINTISEKSNGVKNIKNRCKVLNGQLIISTSLGNGCSYHIKFKKEFYGKG